MFVELQTMREKVYSILSVKNWLSVSQLQIELGYTFGDWRVPFETVRAYRREFEKRHVSQVIVCVDKTKVYSFDKDSSYKIPFANKFRIWWTSFIR